MQKSIGITAIGLIITAGLLKVGAVPFAKWAASQYEFAAFLKAIYDLNPSMYDIINMSTIFPAIYISLCLGCSLLLAATVSTCFKKVFDIVSKVSQHAKSCFEKKSPVVVV